MSIPTSTLGLLLTGTNEDLVLVQTPQEGEPKKGSGTSDDEPDEEGDDEAEGSGDSPSDEDPRQEGDEEGSGGDSEEADDTSDDTDDGEEQDEEPNEGGDDSPSDEPSTPNGDSEEGDAAGGSAPEELPAKEIAEAILQALVDGYEPKSVDSNEALAAAVSSSADDVDLEDNEAVWRPYYPQSDVVRLVKPSSESRAVADALREAVRPGVSFLRNQLRSKFLQARTPIVNHGVKKGRGLSDRRLVSSYVELLAGRAPRRPDWERVEKDACTLSCAVVLDESSSMGKLVAQVAQAAIAVAEPLDALGAPCLVVGPRSIPRPRDHVPPMKPADWVDPETKRPRFHRQEGIIIDVFKDWHERMETALPRFGMVQATGSTPLEDGIQYAMQEMDRRTETHRVVLVVTDGLPNNSAVVRRQIRLAAAAGVYLIGVSVGDASCAKGVRALFPLTVAVTDIAELPSALLGVLVGICFPKNGRRLELDGKIPHTAAR